MQNIFNFITLNNYSNDNFIDQKISHIYHKKNPNITTHFSLFPPSIMWSILPYIYVLPLYLCNEFNLRLVASVLVFLFFGRGRLSISNGLEELELELEEESSLSKPFKTFASNLGEETNFLFRFPMLAVNPVRRFFWNAAAELWWSLPVSFLSNVASSSSLPIVITSIFPASGITERYVSSTQ